MVRLFQILPVDKFRVVPVVLRSAMPAASAATRSLLAIIIPGVISSPESGPPELNPCRASRSDTRILRYNAKEEDTPFISNG